MNILDMIKALADRGYVIGARDGRLNQRFDGAYMVSEVLTDEHELPTQDGRDGPNCVVGDDFEALISTAYQAWGHDE